MWPPGGLDNFFFKTEMPKNWPEFPLGLMSHMIRETCVRLLRSVAIVPCRHLGTCKTSAQSAGFEPARAEPNRFLVYRLNHSATTAGTKSVGLLGLVHSRRCTLLTARCPDAFLGSMDLMSLANRTPQNSSFASIPPVQKLCQKWDSNPRLENQTAT